MVKFIEKNWVYIAIISMIAAYFYNMSVAAWVILTMILFISTAIAVIAIVHYYRKNEMRKYESASGAIAFVWVEYCIFFGISYERIIDGFIAATLPEKAVYILAISVFALIASKMGKEHKNKDSEAKA